MNVTQTGQPSRSPDFNGDTVGSSGRIGPLTLHEGGFVFGINGHGTETVVVQVTVYAADHTTIESLWYQVDPGATNYYKCADLTTHEVHVEFDGGRELVNWWLFKE